MEEKRNVPKLRFPGFTDPWEQRKLGEMFIESEDRSSDLEILSVSVVSGIYPASESDRETNPGASLSSYKIVRKGDVVYNSMRMRQGAVDSSRYDGIVSPAYVVARPTAMAIPRFFARLLKRPELLRQYQRLSQGNSKDTQVLKFDEFAGIQVRVPLLLEEQEAIGAIADALDSLIALHQRKLDHVKELKKGLLQKMFPKEGANVPELRFPGFTDPWEQRRLGDEFDRINERNDGSFGREHWISVSRMFFQDPEAVQSNNIDTRTYVMREGDIAFEGHPNADFQFGRFVANDIGDGVVSELFPVYRHKVNYDNSYWKYAIQLERIMAPIFAKAITSSGNSSNKLDSTHFLKQQILVPRVVEQQAIGALFQKLDSLIALHQRELDHVKELKKGLLQQMFV